MVKHHRHFTSKDEDLVVMKDFPYIGASPDLLIDCECHGPGLCEIKCPKSICDQLPTHQNYKHLIDKDGVVKLSHGSQYFTQIQGQMGITRKKYCDLFVYTAHGYHLERVDFHSVFWDKLLFNVDYFWKTYVAVELLSGDIAHKHEEVDKLQSNTAADHCYCKDDIPT